MIFEYPIRWGGICVRVKYSVILAHFRACSEWKACFTVAACHSADKDVLMEGGTPEEVTSEKTDCCYSQGHLHGTPRVSLKADYHLVETQPDHCDLLQWV